MTVPVFGKLPAANGTIFRAGIAFGGFAALSAITFIGRTWQMFAAAFAKIISGA